MTNRYVAEWQRYRSWRITYWLALALFLPVGILVMGVTTAFPEVPAGIVFMARNDVAEPPLTAAGGSCDHVDVTTTLTERR